MSPWRTWPCATSSLSTRRQCLGRRCAGATDSSGSRCRGCGPAGGRLSSSCHPTPSCGGSGAASASTGPSSPPGPSRAAHPSMLRSRLSSHGWLRPIRCGAPREFTGNFSGWGSTSPSAPSLASCRSGAPCRLRPGGRSSPTMSAIWSPSISSRCQPRACASSLFSSCSLTTAWRVVHFNVTEHPTARWTAQQIVDAFPDDSAPAYLLRDRDQVCGEQFRHRVQGMRIEEVLTAPHSPWQNPFAERLIGSIRRECLDHVLVLGESHLRRILARHFSYYHRARTHLALDKDAPDVGPVELPEVGGIVEIPEVGGLHHRYVRQAAESSTGGPHDHRKRVTGPAQPLGPPAPPPPSPLPCDRAKPTG